MYIMKKFYGLFLLRDFKYIHLSVSTAGLYIKYFFTAFPEWVTSWFIQFFFIQFFYPKNWFIQFLFIQFSLRDFKYIHLGVSTAEVYDKYFFTSFPDWVTSWFYQRQTEKLQSESNELSSLTIRVANTSSIPKNLFDILLNQTEIRLYLLFSD